MYPGLLSSAVLVPLAFVDDNCEARSPAHVGFAQDSGGAPPLASRDEVGASCGPCGQAVETRVNDWNIGAAQRTIVRPLNLCRTKIRE